jgi:YegS/Rv2252/BmrU family lipid kinase
LIAIIINPSAGRARRMPVHQRAALASAIAEQRGERAEVFVTERPGHACELAKASVARGARLVVAWGGDGTINDVASALAFGDRAAMGIIPAGSGNGLARALGIDTRPDRALMEALTAEPRRIDVGELGGRLFVNVAGVGFDAQIAAAFNAPDNRIRGLTGYALLTARGLVSYAPQRYQITSDGRARSVRALLIAVANGTEFGNQIRISPGSSVDDGVLDLVVVQERSRLTTIWNMRRLVTQSIERAPIWSCARVTDATIESDAPMTFHVDGEPVAGGTRLQIRTHAGALRVCVRPSQ